MDNHFSMDLLSVIRSILHSENIVAIPGIGTFKSAYQPARLIKSEQITFKPPQTVISFSQECENDMLTTHIAQICKCTEQEANSQIEAFVMHFKQTMEEKKSVSLKGIGTFLENGDFEPDTSPETSPETFGLSEFSFDKLSDAEKKKIDNAPRK